MRGLGEAVGDVPSRLRESVDDSVVLAHLNQRLLGIRIYLLDHSFEASPCERLESPDALLGIPGLSGKAEFRPGPQVTEV